MPLVHEQQQIYISIWAKVVETQMHFNEMSVKSRQLGLTFVAAALGIGIVLLSRGDDFAIPIRTDWFQFQVHISVLLVMGAVLALLAVRGLDLNVYHKMLRGAVSFGEDFEENYMKQIFDLNEGMTQAISHFSRYGDARVQIGDGNRYVYAGETRVTAEEKIRLFYKVTIISLLMSSILLFVVTNWNFWFAASVSADGFGE